MWWIQCSSLRAIPAGRNCTQLQQCLHTKHPRSPRPDGTACTKQYFIQQATNCCVPQGTPFTLYATQSRALTDCTASVPRPYLTYITIRPSDTGHDTTRPAGCCDMLRVTFLGSACACVQECCVQEILDRYAWYRYSWQL